jgi:hypothetical protein
MRWMSWRAISTGPYLQGGGVALLAAQRDVNLAPHILVVRPGTTRSSMVSGERMASELHMALRRAPRSSPTDRNVMFKPLDKLVQKDSPCPIGKRLPHDEWFRVG